MERRRRLLAGFAAGGAAGLVGLYGIVRAVDALRETAERGPSITPEAVEKVMSEFIVFGFGGGLLLACGVVLAGLCFAARARMRREEREEADEREELDGPA